MSLIKKSAAFLALAAAITACDDGKGPGNPDAYQGKQGGGSGNECSQQFLNEYNDVARTARYVQQDLETGVETTANRAQTKSDAQTLKDKATALRAKYEGVSCIAEDPDTGKKQAVDVNRSMDDALKAAAAALKVVETTPVTGGSTGHQTRQGEQCSSAFLNEYLAVTSFAKTVADDLDLPDTAGNRAKTRTDAEKLKSQAKALKAKYPGYKCEVGSGTSRYAIDVDVKMDDLAETAQSVIDLLDGGGTRPSAALLAPTEYPAVRPARAVSR